MKSKREWTLVSVIVLFTVALYGCSGTDSGAPGLTPMAETDYPGPVVTSHTSGMNDMIDAANDGPGGTSSGDHATGLITRIGTTNGSGGIDGAAVLSTPLPPRSSSSIVQSTQANEPDVNVNAAWSATAAAPTLSVDLGRAAVGPFRRSLLDPVRIAAPVPAPGNMIPSLGGNWNDAALQRRVVGGTTVYTAVYSDIEKGGEIQRSHYIDFAYTTKKGMTDPAPGNGEVEPDMTDASPILPAPGTPLPTPSTIKYVNDQSLGIDIGARQPIRFDIGGRWFEVERDWSRPVPVAGGGQLDATQVAGPLGGAVPNPITAKLTCVNGRSTGQDSCEGVQRNSRDGSLEGLWRLDVETVSQDEAYLSLGVWLSLPDLADGRFDAGAFAEGSMPFTRGDLNKLTGEVKYEGPATGLYTTGVYPRPRASTDGRPNDCNCPVVEGAHVGSFVAKAELVANFGTTATDPPMVGGFIQDFREEGMSLGSWSVELVGADNNGMIADDATYGDATTALLNGMTMGEADGRILEGQWGVQFFSNGNDSGVAPGYAAGTFSASTQDENTPLDVNALHIIGAFGTEK